MFPIFVKVSARLALPTIAIASGLSAAVARSASADVTVNFNQLTISQYQYLDLTTLFSGFTATGTLTAVQACITLDGSGGLVRCDEFSVYLDPPPLSTGGLLQVGGFSNLSAAQRYFWSMGGSPLAGTTIQETVTLTSAIYVPADDPTAPAPRFYFGNNSNAGAATWSGSVTFIGLDGSGGDPCVPAPGGVALLALGGLVRRNRQR